MLRPLPARGTPAACLQAGATQTYAACAPHPRPAAAAAAAAAALPAALPALHPTDAAARAAALARLAGVARGHAAGVARGTALEALGRCSAGLLGDAGDLGADGAPATMRGRRELDELLGTAGASAGRSAVAPVSPAWFYGRIKPG